MRCYSHRCTLLTVFSHPCTPPPPLRAPDGAVTPHSTTTAATMLAARALARAAPRVRRAPAVPRRTNMTVPKYGTPAEMEAEAIAQLRARVRVQQQIQNSTGHSETEELAEMWKWIKISVIVVTPLCGLSVAKDVLLVDHAHRGTGPMPEYMAIQGTSFPWECETCPLFDLECWKKCREEMAAENA